jgi:putative membrane protein
MKLARLLLIGHLAALVFGLAGLLIALPNPQWWAGDPRAQQVFDFGMSYGGATHILFGAAAMFAYAWVVIGKRRTLIFFAVSCLLSLSSELIGTGTGWPFGNYAYTDFLGYKVLGRVPFTIPLSWFYLGLAAYMLGTLLASRIGGRLTFWALFFGVWLLTAWDLVLDPAMADPSLRVQFWTWHESGPYFGMPIQNLVGWSVTGLLYMGLSRLLWRQNLVPAALAPTSWFPFAVYAANLIFAMILSLGAGLWPPVVLALIAGMVPAWLAMRSPDSRAEGAPRPATVWRPRAPEAPRHSA